MWIFRPDFPAILTCQRHFLLILLLPRLLSQLLLICSACINRRPIDILPLLHCSIWQHYCHIAFSTRGRCLPRSLVGVLSLLPIWDDGFWWWLWQVSSHHRVVAVTRALNVESALLHAIGQLEFHSFFQG